MTAVGTLTYRPARRADARDEWELAAQPAVMMRAKRLFPRAVQHASTRLRVTATDEVTRDLEMLSWRYELDLRGDAAERLQAGADRHREQGDRLLAILEGRARPLPDLEPARAALAHQHAPAAIAIDRGRLLLADELGLGKTQSAAMLFGYQQLLPGLVVVPPNLAKQWVRELHRIWPMLKVHVAATTEAYDPAQRRGSHGQDPDVLIVSYPKLQGWANYLHGRVRSVVFDEIQDLRHPTTKKYAAAELVAQGAAVRMGLTGTPVYNYGGEAFNLMHILDEDALGTQLEFAREWCTGPWGPKVRVKEPRALGAYLRTEGLLLRRSKADVGIDTTEPQRITHDVDLDTKVLDDLLARAGTLGLAERLLDPTRPPKEAFTTAGDFDWQMRKATGVAKAPYVAEFVRLLLESERKVLLAGWHRDVYDIWLKRLAEYHPRLYTGTESPTQKDAAVQAFTDLHDSDQPVDGECRVMMLSLRSGAGIDGLQHACRVVVFGELDWAPPVHDQVIGRLDRPGQTREVLAYFLTADDGADPVIAQTLDAKRRQGEPIRDPDAALFDVTTNNDGDRIRAMARDALARRSSRAARDGGLF